MSFRHTTGFEIEFGDCDPVGIVFYPNYYRWMDAAARHFFLAAGVPSWTETAASDGIIGAPLLETSARYLKPATYGERIAVDTSVAEWRGKSFVLAHAIRRASRPSIHLPGSARSWHSSAGRRLAPADEARGRRAVG